MNLVGVGIGLIVIGLGIGIGNIGKSALDAMARQPEMAGTIRTSMLIGQAVSETTGLYGLIIAILIVFM